MQPMQQRTAERALDALSFFVSDARYGLGAYLGVYLLAEHGWNPGSIGAALSIGAFTGLVAQAPLGALVDAVRAKRALIAGAVVVVTATAFGALRRVPIFLVVDHSRTAASAVLPGPSGSMAAVGMRPRVDVGMPFLVAHSRTDASSIGPGWAAVDSGSSS